MLLTIPKYFVSLLSKPTSNPSKYPSVSPTNPPTTPPPTVGPACSIFTQIYRVFTFSLIRSLLPYSDEPNNLGKFITCHVSYLCTITCLCYSPFIYTFFHSQSKPTSNPSKIPSVSPTNPPTTPPPTNSPTIPPPTVRFAYSILHIY